MEKPELKSGLNSSAFSPWQLSKEDKKDEEDEPINVDEFEAVKEEEEETKTKIRTKPSVFSVTSLLAPDNPEDRGGTPSPKAPPVATKAEQEQELATRPFFYPGLTLDMLAAKNRAAMAAAVNSDGSLFGRNAAAAALAAATGSPMVPPFGTLGGLFPHVSAFPTLAAMKSASIDANRNLLSSPPGLGAPGLPFHFPLPSFSGSNQSTTSSPPSSTGSSSTSLELDLMRFRSSAGLRTDGTNQSNGSHSNPTDSRRAKRPFACEICNKTFGHEISLTQHR